MWVTLLLCPAPLQWTFLRQIIATVAPVFIPDGTICASRSPNLCSHSSVWASHQRGGLSMSLCYGKTFVYSWFHKSSKYAVISTLFSVFCVYIISVDSGINSTYCNNHLSGSSSRNSNRFVYAWLHRALKYSAVSILFSVLLIFFASVYSGINSSLP